MKSNSSGKTSACSFSGQIRVLVAARADWQSRLIVNYLTTYNWCIPSESGRDTESLATSLACFEPAVILIGADLGALSERTKNALQVISSFSRRIRSILLLENAESEAVLNAFRAGASGVLCTSDSAQTLAQSIQAVHQGQLFISEGQLTLLERAPEDQRLARRRERSILKTVTSRGLMAAWTGTSKGTAGIH